MIGCMNDMDRAARLRPGMYTGPQGDRTREEWENDAISALCLMNGYIDAYNAKIKLDKHQK